jgi:hypothetical protein
MALALADLHVFELDYVRHELIKAGAEDTSRSIRAIARGSGRHGVGMSRTARPIGRSIGSTDPTARRCGSKASSS